MAMRPPPPPRKFDGPPSACSSPEPVIVAASRRMLPPAPPATLWLLMPPPLALIFPSSTIDGDWMRTIPPPAFPALAVAPPPPGSFGSQSDPYGAATTELELLLRSMPPVPPWLPEAAKVLPPVAVLFQVWPATKPVAETSIVPPQATKSVVAATSRRLIVVVS